MEGHDLMLDDHLTRGIVCFAGARKPAEFWRCLQLDWSLSHELERRKTTLGEIKQVWKPT